MTEFTSSWQRFRQQMPVARRFAYLDHAATAPISGPASEAVQAWLRQAAELGGAAWPEWEEGVNQVRQTAADLIGAAPEEVALVPNTTAGINLVAEGFPWREGDNVVTLANEFPSNQYPWMNLAGRGVETRRVPVEDGRVDLDRLSGACDGRTRIVAVSWIGYASGWRMDLEALVALAHARSSLVFLDAIQGLGVFPIHAGRLGIDFLAADGHKWLLGPEGAGLLFVRREHLSSLRPLSVGWNSVVHAHDFNRIELNLRPDAARYEGGSRNMAGHLALGASLRLLASLGLGTDTSALADRVLAVTDYAVRRLEAIGAAIKSCRGPQHRSGIVAFELPGQDPVDLRRRCLQAGVVLSVRGGNLRISPHAYNDESDIERLVEVLSGTDTGKR